MLPSCYYQLAMNKALLMIGLAMVALLAGALVLVLTSGSERFELVENIEPQPLPLVDQDQPGWVAPNTLQASPAALQEIVTPGAELPPITISNSFRSPLQMTVKSKGLPGLQLSQTSWRQPARSSQQLGLRLPANFPASRSGQLLISARLPRELSLNSKVRGRELSFRRDLQLDVPILVAAPSQGGRLQEVGPPAANLAGLQLGTIGAGSPAGPQLQPQVQITNLSERSQLATGFFVLQGQKTYRLPLASGQTILPGATVDLLAQRPWPGIPAGNYRLQASVRLGRQSQALYKNIAIDSQGQVVESKTRPVSLALGAERGSLQIAISNQDKNRSLPPTTLIINPQGQPVSKQRVPSLDKNQQQSLYQPLPKASKITAQLLLGDRRLAQSSLQLKAASEPGATENLLLLIVPGMALLIAISGIVVYSRRHQR